MNVIKLTNLPIGERYLDNLARGYDIFPAVAIVVDDICGRVLSRDKITVDHIFPRTLRKDFNIDYVIKLLNRKTTRLICDNCNQCLSFLASYFKFCRTHQDSLFNKDVCNLSLEKLIILYSETEKVFVSDYNGFTHYTPKDIFYNIKESREYFDHIVRDVLNSKIFKVDKLQTKEVDKLQTKEVAGRWLDWP